MSYGSKTPSMPTFNFSSGGGGGGGTPNPLRWTAGLLGNLGQDIAHAATGFFPGLKKLATDPVVAIGDVIDQYRYTYGPAFHGDLGETGERIYENPLGPILDVAALFTGGAAAAGKSAQIAKAQGLVSAESKVGRLAEYSSTPNVRVLQDIVGSPSRRDTFASGASAATPRVPILRYGSSNAWSKFRTQKIDQFKTHLSSKGGVFGIDPKQIGYERAYLADVSGAAGAVELWWGKVDRALQNTEGMAPFQRTNTIRGMYYHNWEQNLHHAIADNRVALYDDFMKGNYNRQAYEGLVRKGEPLKGQKDGKWWANPDNAEVSQAFRNLGHRLATKDPMRVHTFRGEDGQKYVPLVNRQTAENLGIESANTANGLVNAYYKGTAVWKAAVLGLVPRFFVNNAIGNSFMYLMDNAGDGAIFGMYKSRQYMKGEHKADTELAEMVDEAGVMRRGGFVEMFFGDQVAQAFHSSALPTTQSKVRYDRRKHEYEDGIDPRTPSQQMRGETAVKENIITRAAQPLLRFASKHAERNLRVAVIMLRTRKLPQHKAEVARLKKMFPKWTEEKIFNEAAINVFRKNPALHKEISQRVEQSMGNYNMLSLNERRLRAIDPFYTWQRHIFKHTFHMAAERPGRLDLAARLGTEGYEDVQEMFGGNAPDFMGGMIPVSIPGLGADNRQLMFNTAGMNPYAAFGEEAKMFQSLIPGGEGPQIGETLGTQMNPFVQAGVEGLTGTTLLTGQPKSTKIYGPVDQFLKSIAPFDIPVQPFANLPHVRGTEHAFFPAEYDSPTLYAKNPTEDLSSFFGFPLRDVYLPRVPALAEAQKTRRGEE